MAQDHSSKGAVKENKDGTLHNQHIADFYEKGWIALPNLFSVEELKASQQAFDRLIIEANKIKTTQEHLGSLFVLSEKNNTVIINRIVWAGAAEQELLKISEDKRILKPVSQLLESSSMEQLLCQAHFKLPGDGVSFDWHQDIQHRDKGPGTWSDLNKKGSYVQSILLLDDMTEENGALQFMPESSTWGRIFDSGYEYDTPLSQGHSPKSIDQSKAITVTATAGSLILFGPYTVHASAANNSQQARRILINGYAYPGANSRTYPGKGSGRRLSVDS